MQNFTAARGRSILISLLLITILICIKLFLHNDIYLITAVIGGYLTAVYYIFMLAMRIKRSMALSQLQAKRSSQMGFLFRIIVLFLVWFIVLKLSKEVFIAFIAGFFIMHIIIFTNLIIFSYREKMH